MWHDRLTPRSNILSLMAWLTSNCNHQMTAAHSQDSRGEWSQRQPRESQASGGKNQVY